MPGSKKQNSMFGPSTGYIQKNNPFPVTSCGRRRNTGSPLYSKAEPRRTIGPGKNFNKANPTGTGAAAGGGMTQKGVDEYKRKNPGSKLQTAVTTPPSQLKKGSKAANRRKSFCARSRGWTGERGRAARRRWNC
jgi:hypothetical protein|tara:strand:- start:1843 stop:2244 length:402 start_codon:yes stop_codon:yes gene_type:complete